MALNLKMHYAAGSPFITTTTKTTTTKKSNSCFPQSPRFTRILGSSCSCSFSPTFGARAGDVDNHAALNNMVRQFDPTILIQDAFTPPTSWYTHPPFLSLEFHRVFLRGWQPVGLAEQLKDPGSFFTGRLGNVEYVICKDISSDNTIRAFHNVCSHHASLLVSGTGHASCFACPYHGWTYGLDGSLLKATRLSGIRNFHVQEFGLKPLRVAIWGPFVLLNCQQEEEEEKGTSSTLKEADHSLTHHVEHQWLGSSAEILTSNGIIDSSLTFICRREYTIQSNWKVFCDNYLDGGYHVPYAHKGLASSLKLDSYSTTIFEKVSIQRCSGSSIRMAEDEFDRLGSNALYAFIYPNFMVNRYGPWMDTNLVIPLGPRKCKVIFDYFLDSSLKDNKSFIEESLKDSEQVQMEDIALCEAVQRGLESPAYRSGRYAPSVEKAMHHFHSLLHHDLLTN